jgi:hypothetical protein
VNAAPAILILPVQLDSRFDVWAANRQACAAIRARSDFTRRRGERINSPERRDRLCPVNALAVVLLTMLGAAGEALGFDKHL